MRIVLGVGGGIAAYKAASLLRLFTEAGHDVTVIPTDASTRFVGIATWEALSGKSVSTSVFDGVETVNHVRLGHEADLIVVAPATADLLARAAAGMADDLLTSTLLMASGPVVFAPAMHSEMWRHPATARNVTALRDFGAIVLDPDSGRLTGADSGPGRLPDPERIYAAALAAEAAGRDTENGHTRPPLAGRTVTVTAGGTREPLDPVRFLGNRSSGRQGVALATAAVAAGATVRLIGAHLDASPPAGVSVQRVETAEQLREATLSAACESDVVIMAAAVADYRPADVAEAKIKKRDDVAAPVITLIRNPDILAELVRRRDDARRHDPSTAAGPYIVGFAAETGDDDGDVLEYGRAKLKRKGCDLLVVNQVGGGRGFGTDDNEVTILSPGTDAVDSVADSKAQVSTAVIARIAAALPTRQ